MNEQDNFRMLKRFILGTVDEEIRQTYPIDVSTAIDALTAIERKYNSLNKQTQKNVQYGTNYRQKRYY